MEKRTPQQTQKIKREALRLRSKGWTLVMIGRKYGITRQRVHQMIGKVKRFEQVKA
jgi:DNA-directed RNA polymerase sigma subunit (sigma70/sigma32)